MPVSLAKGFTFSEVVTILMTVFKVADAKRDTFVGRIQQLQKIGIPKGTNVGRGAKANYVNWQLADLMLALDLLDAGITPAALTAGLSDETQTIISVYAVGGYGWHVQESLQEDHKDLYLLLRFNALEYLKPERSGGARPSVLDLTQHGRTADTLIADLEEGPAIVMNLTQRFRALRDAVESVYPHRLGDITFYPTRTGSRGG